MVPKSGNLTEPTNWRPIAILSVFYKLFSRMVYSRLRAQLEGQQSSDQTGFRTGIRLEDALAIAETLIGKTSEWNLPLFIASLDLKKAFDRVEHGALFQALRDQGAEEPYISLLLEMYRDQTATANGSRSFSIHRGVRQGDVLSSLLFNAALELVFRRWKARLTEHGWLINPTHERLTNTRYADDCLLYAKSLPELQAMLETLHDELSAVGLEIHETKTKVLTSSNICEVDSLPVRGMTFQILSPEASHRYLGRRLSLNATVRVETEINNRISAAWAKFHCNRRWLVNKHIPLKLRMRFFEACVKPTATFALHVLPLKVANTNRLAATERRMKRCIVGWIRHAEEDWPTTMRRMRVKVELADQAYPTKSWVECIWSQQWRFICHLHGSLCVWPRLLATWQPNGHRSQGRPVTCWDDHINKYCRDRFQCSSWTNMTRSDLLRESDSFSASMCRSS